MRIVQSCHDGSARCRIKNIRMKKGGRRNLRCDAELRGICRANVCSVRLYCGFEVAVGSQVEGEICAWHIVSSRCQCSSVERVVVAQSAAKVVVGGSVWVHEQERCLQAILLMWFCA